MNHPTGEPCKQWWRNRTVYQIYPRSFQDSNGDGIGDIPGIISRLDYLEDLGIGIIWLSPVYASPNEDNGYDISDYRSINPEFGTMDDMDRLLHEAEKRNLRIVMDLVINHTSDRHAWFQASRDKDSPYRDYYIWRPGKPDGNLPNNWTSFFAEDCWEYDERSGEYYLHLFAKGQPDLNWRNPKVMEEIRDIMRFWLDKGVSGFRCDVINIIWKSSLEDGKKRIALTGREHYISQNGAHDVLRRLRRDVLNHYDCFTVGETVFVTPSMGRDLCDADRGELDMIFSFQHMEVDQWFVKWIPRRFRPWAFMKVISRWQNELEWCANYLENHDQPRSVSRFGDDGKYRTRSATMLATMLLTLRGTPYVYQGQEIGMTNRDFRSPDEIRDLETHNFLALAEKLRIPAGYRWKMVLRACRDHSRTPMQWNNSPAAGFTSGTPWLDVNPGYDSVNVFSQADDEGSVLSHYRRLIALRSSSPVLIKGSFEKRKIGHRVFAYCRVLDEKRMTVVLNFSSRARRTGFSGRVILSNAGRNPEENWDGALKPWEGIIVG